MLLTVKHLSKSYGATTVLSDVSFAVNRGERAGLVGANGAGKSTLLRILTGQETPDAGGIALAASVELGYLPQTTPEFFGRTLEDLIHESVGELRRVEARMRELEAAMADRASRNGSSLEAALDEYGTLSTRFADRGGYELDHRIGAVLAGLRLDYLPRDRDVRTLSGGERARVGIAALLLRSPDLLLLDEPTNHLDADTLDWLEGYLRSYAGAALVVLHDRQFLNATVTRILELDDATHELREHAGDYDAYAAAKVAARAKWEEDYARQQEEIAELRRSIRETARQVSHNRAPTDNDKSANNFFGERVQNTVSRNVRSAQVRLARIEADPVPKPPKPLRFAPQFRTEMLQSRTVLAVEGVWKCFVGRDVLCGASLELRPMARMVLVGPNGAGKTTLLRLLLGLEAPDAGEVRRAPGARVGYLPQDSAPLDPDRTVLDTYTEGLTGPEGTLVASILGNGLFRLEDLSKRVGQLSVGQRRKLEIARLVAERPNALVLDEPANAISLDVLEAFEAAVLEFPGPVLVVSHDRWFLRRFGGEVWRLRDGTLRREDG
jgi:macrolide transport system ATP-binding/permease protein